MKTFSLLLALPALVAAQVYAPPSPGPTSSSSAPLVAPSAPANTPGHINVDVGSNGNLVYNPSNFNASVGTLVTFWFPSALAHSVTQSTFANPCTYMAAANGQPGGFDSGLQTSVNFTINITDLNPIYFHCEQVSHCGSGMVGAINAPATGNGSFAALQAAAMALGGSFSDPNASASSFISGGVDGIPTGTPVPDLTSSNTNTGAASQLSTSFGVVAVSVLAGLTMLY